MYIELSLSFRSIFVLNHCREKQQSKKKKKLYVGCNDHREGTRQSGSYML